MGEHNISGIGHYSHAYMICADTMDKSFEAAKELAAGMLCSAVGEHPCGECRSCRKVAADIHPDLITIRLPLDSKGNEKPEITVDQIRAMNMEAHILPNEAERKIFLVRNADAMNPAAQNAALKLLEEPPKGVIIALCVTNPLLVLPTVRSRCVEINVNGTDRDGVPQLAREYISLVTTGDRAELLAWCFANEQMDKRLAADFLKSALELVADMLCSGESGEKDRKTLMELSGLLAKCRNYIKVNTNVRHIFGLLAVRSISEAD